MNHIDPIKEMNHARNNANQSDARDMTIAMRVWSNPDQYMDSKQDCSSLMKKGLKALEKYGANSSRH